ncbi:MAG: glycosyltransferase [Actinobacteria bacterium]|jgi:glycosyltransferase involved in cell wall biosynthesis|nr:glycosyltransferase [Actinomycetota bacterium]
MALLSGHVTILSSADNVADARMHRLTNSLLRANISVDIWALGHSNDAPKGATFHRAPGGKRKFARVMRDLILPFKAAGSVVLVVAPDLLPITYLVTKLRRQKMIADVHEDYVQLLKDRSWAKGLVGFLAKIIAKLATVAAARADLTTVADSQVPPQKAKNRFVLKNLPDYSLLTNSGDMAPEPRAIYVGDVRKSRGLQMMLETAELSPRWHFDIVGNISESDSEFVANWLKVSSAKDRVVFHGRLAPQESWKFAQGAWVGLTLLEPTPAFVEAVPSKLYEYAATGLATISTSLPRCVELLKQSGGGLTADSASDVAKILNGWSEDNQQFLKLVKFRESALSWAKSALNSDEQYAAFAHAVGKLTFPTTTSR